jgi:hypothetical protein
VGDGFYGGRGEKGEERKGKEGGEYFVIYSVNYTGIDPGIDVVICGLEEMEWVDWIGTRGS